jgi:hypothetical protein
MALVGAPCFTCSTSAAACWRHTFGSAARPPPLLRRCPIAPPHRHKRAQPEGAACCPQQRRLQRRLQGVPARPSVAAEQLNATCTPMGCDTVATATAAAAAAENCPACWQNTQGTQAAYDEYLSL